MKLNGKSKILENLALISQVGISMIVPIFIGILLGNFIDKKLGTTAVFLIIFSILGISSSFVALFKITAGQNKRK